MTTPTRGEWEPLCAGDADGAGWDGGSNLEPGVLMAEYCLPKEFTDASGLLACSVCGRHLLQASIEWTGSGYSIILVELGTNEVVGRYAL
jgi:hypothetical protein